MTWQWRQIETLDDAAEYLEVLQYDARIRGKTEYPNTDADSIHQLAHDKDLGYYYWLASNPDTGAKMCYMVRALPTDQHTEVGNEPKIQHIGAMPGHDGVGWERVFARAPQQLWDHMQVIAAMLRESSVWKTRRFHANPIDKVTGRLLARETAKVADADLASIDEASHRFAFLVSDGDD